MKEVQVELCLREKEVPHVVWEGVVNAGQDSEEVVVECVWIARLDALQW